MKNRTIRNHHQRGMALLVVLMITAMMTMIAVNMNDYGLRAFNRASSAQFHQQSKWLLLSMESLVQRQQLLPLPTDSVHLGQAWARTPQHLTLDGNQVNFSIRDRQACFNLNGIAQSRGVGGTTETKPEAESPIEVDTDAKKPPMPEQGKENNKEEKTSIAYSQQVFQHLLRTQGLDAARAQQVTFALADWIDNDDISRSGGSEAAQYLEQRPILVPANRPLLDISEFRVLPGVDQALYLRLKPLICTLPNQNLRININTLSQAQAPLLSALFLGEMSVEEAQQLIASRPANGWNSVNDLKPFIEENHGAFARAKTAITLTSDHFELLLWLDEEQHSNRLRSRLQRNRQTISVLSRQYGFGD
ncbi:type II secretion system minor pseudopilin GspK [Yersinia ruckeri]|uniref:type II secretion system minor pseudopilin GspK n=1 Tax=Yersinia ruckeri TaxID=29486 RepID=UPI0020BEFCF9|nr:type II secretion system minor pseudopilin GspK [Yersinia ruckeri]MCK8555708.1 type II secretion system minor pseudopilin GspK [Yersinia ruckeri]